MLHDPKLRLPVAKYLTNFESETKEEKDQLIIEWYKYSITYPDRNTSNMYFIPFDGSDAYEEGTNITQLRGGKYVQV